jgi:heme oxygenase
MTGLHEFLRRRTTKAHRALDARLLEAGFLDSLSGFSRFLQGWYLLQTRVEHVLQSNGVESLLPDWPRRRRALLLQRDLAAVGFTPPPPLPLPVRTSSEPPRLEALLGIGYVAEGATLGAAVLLKRYTDKGITVAAGSEFLRACSAGRGTLWPAFLSILEAHASRVDPEAVAAAANDAFAWANDAFFSQCLPAPPERRRSPREPRHATAR